MTGSLKTSRQRVNNYIILGMDRKKSSFVTVDLFVGLLGEALSHGTNDVLTELTSVELG